MVLPASDFQQAPSAVPASQAGMGEGAQAGMPTVQDVSVPSETPSATPGAAPQGAPPPIDVAQIPAEVRSFLETHFRDGYIPAADLQNLQSVKDREIADAHAAAEHARVQSQIAQAQVSRAMERFNGYVQEVINGKRNPHPNDAASFLLDMQQAGAQVQMTRSQAALEHRNWIDTHTAGFNAALDQEARGGNGLPPVDRGAIANDAEVQRLNSELLETAKADARELYKNPTHSQRAFQIQRALEQRISHVAQQQRLAAVSQPMAREMALVDTNLTRQADRGVQTTTSTGLGALVGGFDTDTVWRQAAQTVSARTGIPLDKVELNHYDDVYALWEAEYDKSARR